MNSRWADAAEWRAALVLLVGSMALLLWFHGVLLVVDAQLDERERDVAARHAAQPDCCAPLADGGR